MPRGFAAAGGVDRSARAASNTQVDTSRSVTVELVASSSGLPWRFEAIERGLVGALFVDASLLPACEKLKPSDFALPDCARIFGAIVARAKATGRVELVLVANDLGDPDMKPATAPSWLVACSRLLDESLADEDSVSLYVAAIRDAAIQRRVERRRA